MRVCMRPVSLGRLVDIAKITESMSSITPEIVSQTLSCSESRACEILDEMCDLKMLTNHNKIYFVTDKIRFFRNAVITGNWEEVHRLFQDHIHYKAYYEMVCKLKSATLEVIFEELVKQETPHFNIASLDIVADWAERIASVQRNVISGEIYPVISQEIQFKDEFIKTYNELNYTSTIFMKQIYVEIPKLREYVCQKCCLSRNIFDTKLVNLFLKNIGKIELSGAPLTTHAKKTSKKIKYVTSISYSDRLSMKLTSYQYLFGIEINGRMYYYLAYHGGELID